jgi:hypothetical protein
VRNDENVASINVSVQLPGEKLLIRLWETLDDKGVGSWINPYRAKRNGIPRLEVGHAEKLALAEVEKDVQDIRAGRKRLEDFSSRTALARDLERLLAGNDAAESAINFPSLVDIAGTHAAVDGARRELNVAKAVLHAESALKEDPQEPPPARINDDWLVRWRNCAGEVSAEELQTIWGRVLSEEIKYPGWFSLRTLDFIRNLSQQEANDIAKLSRFVVSGVIWSEAKDLLATEGIDFGFLLKMQDLGLISGVGGMGLQMVWKSVLPKRFAHALSSNGKALVLTHPDPSKTASIPEYSLTAIGLQVLQLGRFEPHIPYLRRLGTTLARQGFSVSLGDHKRTSRTEIQVFNMEELGVLGDLQAYS